MQECLWLVQARGRHTACFGSALYNLQPQPTIRIQLTFSCGGAMRPITQPLHAYLYLYITWKLVRTIVLSRHGSNLNLTRSVIIHDVIHSLMCMLSTPHCGFSGVSPDGNCTYVHWGSFTYNSKSVRQAIWFTWFSEPHDTTSLHDVLV